MTSETLVTWNHSETTISTPSVGQVYTVWKADPLAMCGRGRAERREKIDCWMDRPACVVGYSLKCVCPRIVTQFSFVFNDIYWPHLSYSLDVYINFRTPEICCCCCCSCRWLLLHPRSQFLSVVTFPFGAVNKLCPEMSAASSVHSSTGWTAKKASAR